MANRINDSISGLVLRYKMAEEKGSIWSKFESFSVVIAGFIAQTLTKDSGKSEWVLLLIVKWSK